MNKANSTNGSISSYFVRRELNSTSPINSKRLDGLEDVSKLLRVVKIKEPINQDPGEYKNGTNRYKVYIKRKLKTIKHKRKYKKDREGNATRTYMQSYHNHVNHLPASKSRVHYEKISIGKPVTFQSKSTIVSYPYAVRNTNRYERHRSEAHLERSGKNGEASTVVSDLPFSCIQVNEIEVIIQFNS